MGWLLRDERNMRRHRPPAQHHEPPLGWILSEQEYNLSVELEDAGCGDCGWTPEGEFEKCEEHKDEDAAEHSAA